MVVSESGDRHVESQIDRQIKPQFLTLFEGNRLTVGVHVTI